MRRKTEKVRFRPSRRGGAADARGREDRGRRRRESLEEPREDDPGAAGETRRAGDGGSAWWPAARLRRPQGRAPRGAAGPQGHHPRPADRPPGAGGYMAAVRAPLGRRPRQDPQIRKQFAVDAAIKAAKPDGGLEVVESSRRVARRGDELPGRQPSADLLGGPPIPRGGGDLRAKSRPACEPARPRAPGRLCPERARRPEPDSLAPRGQRPGTGSALAARRRRSSFSSASDSRRSSRVRLSRSALASTSLAPALDGRPMTPSRPKHSPRALGRDREPDRASPRPAWRFAYDTPHSSWFPVARPSLRGFPSPVSGRRVSRSRPAERIPRHRSRRRSGRSGSRSTIRARGSCAGRTTAAARSGASSSPGNVRPRLQRVRELPLARRGE